MVTSKTREGTLDLPDTFVKAIVQHAERRALLIIRYLRSTKLGKAKVIRFPEPALLELGAVLELGVWERRGLLSQLDVDLPTYREAADQLAARCMKGPSAFEEADDAPLYHRMLRVWTEYLAWDGPEFIQAEVVLGDFDDDEFINLLAEFVWSRRRELEHLIQEINSDEES